ncbi:hypothetical protein LINGRAHAP2_LOCUS29460 [Linum grandiflorum]
MSPEVATNRRYLARRAVHQSCNLQGKKLSSNKFAQKILQGEIGLRHSRDSTVRFGRNLGNDAARGHRGEVPDSGAVRRDYVEDPGDRYPVPAPEKNYVQDPVSGLLDAGRGGSER